MKFKFICKSKSESKSKSKSESKSTKTLKKKGGGNSKCIIYYIHSDTCGHCIDFNPTWDAIQKDYSDKHIMKKIHIENMPAHIQTATVPHIVAERDNKLTPFLKNRTPSNLMKFLDNL